jgi:hypothetical protein
MPEPLFCIADKTVDRVDVVLDGGVVKNNESRPRPSRGTYGVDGVVPVKLKVDVKRRVAFVL